MTTTALRPTPYLDRTTPASPAGRWLVTGGAVLWPSEMTDQQLKQALSFGLTEAARELRAQGEACLEGAAGCDVGTVYMAEAQSESYFAQARDIKQLYRHLSALPRYAGVMREARGRLQAQRAIEKAAARHTPR